MEPEIRFKQTWHLIEAPGGLTYVPDDCEPDDGRVIDTVEGKYATRWWMPGYVDATPWILFDSLEDCVAHLFEECALYDDRDCGPSETDFDKVRDLADGLLAETHYSVEKCESTPRFGDRFESWIVVDERGAREGIVRTRSIHLHAVDAYSAAIAKAEKYGGLE